MYLSQIQLRQFRSYTDETFSFDPGVTIITGANGIGKTNVLEAIYMFASGKSFRDADEKLTHYHRDAWKLTATIDEKQREIRFSEGKKKFVVDDVTFQRMTLRLKLPIVLFEPDELMLVHGSPTKRRQYIDTVTSIVFPDHMTLLKRYERIVAQRNRLLKQAIIDQDYLFVWDISLADIADTIVSRRLKVVSALNDTISTYYSHIARRSAEIKVKYRNSVPEQNYKQNLLTGLKENLKKDQITGFTSLGPHRDDVEFGLDGKTMLTTSSRGEIRSLLLSLKRFEIEQQRERFDTAPLLLLDDVFSELDEIRQQQLIEEYYTDQMIITSTHSIKGEYKEIKIKP